MKRWLLSGDIEADTKRGTCTRVRVRIHGRKGWTRVHPSQQTRYREF